MKHCSPKMIAIVGGMGFIGRHLIKQMTGRYNFVVIARTNRLNIEPGHFRPSGTTVDSFIQNFSDIDAVVHLAALRPDSSKEAPLFEKYLPNIQVSAAIFEACRQLDITNIVNISSMSVYSPFNCLPFTEDQKPVPKNLYGLVKKNVEDLANFYNYVHGLSIKSLRLAQVIGLGEKESFMFTSFLNQAVAKQTLRLWGKGTGKREYVYVKDVVSAIIRSLDLSEVKGVFNIGTGVSTSHRELAETINRVFDNSDNIKWVTSKSEDTTVSVMDVGKAEKILGWRSQRNIETSLEDIKKELFSTKVNM